MTLRELLYWGGGLATVIYLLQLAQRPARISKVGADTSTTVFYDYKPEEWAIL
jgi:hypothetical protein